MTELSYKDKVRFALLMRGIDPDKTPAKGEPLGAAGTPSAKAILNAPTPATPEDIYRANNGDDGRISRNPHVMGAIGSGAAAALTGGGAIPVGIAALLGGLSNTHGQAAASTALGGIPVLKPASLLARLGLGAGAGMGATAIQHGVDENRLPTAGEAGVNGILGAALEGLPGLIPKPKSPSPVDVARQAADAIREQHAQTAKTLQKQLIESTGTANSATTAKVLAQEIAKEQGDKLDKAKDALKGIQDQQVAANKKSRQLILQTQADHGASIEQARMDRRGALDDLDAKFDALTKHQDAMAEKEAQAAADAKKAQTGIAATLNDKAVAKANALARLNIVKRYEAGPIGRPVAEENIPTEKLRLTVERNNLRNQASKAGKGIGIDIPAFEHDPEDLAKLDELQTAHDAATQNVQDINQNIAQLQALKATHKAESFKLSPPTINDQNVLDRVDSATQAAEDAKDAFRDKRRAEILAKADAQKAKTDFALHMADKPAPAPKPEESKTTKITDFLNRHKTGGGAAVATILGEELARHAGLGPMAIPAGLAVGGAAATIGSSPAVGAALQNAPSLLPGLPSAPDTANAASQSLLARIQALLGGAPGPQTPPLAPETQQ